MGVIPTVEIKNPEAPEYKLIINQSDYDPLSHVLWEHTEGVEEPEEAIAPSLPPESSEPPTEKLNINSATLEELIGLPQIGVAKAKKIQELQPDYKSIEDLKVVLPGVNWAELSDRISF